MIGFDVKNDFEVLGLKPSLVPRLFFFVCWNMKKKLQKHGEKENTYTHA